MNSYLQSTDDQKSYQGASMRERIFSASSTMTAGCPIRKHDLRDSLHTYTKVILKWITDLNVIRKHWSKFHELIRQQR